jgi:hypothetical protein
MINAKRALEIWHRIDAVVGAFLVLGATFGGGMAVQGVLDSSERAGLYTQIQATRADTEASCSNKISDLQRTYVDPTGPTQSLIKQLNDRVSEQATNLTTISQACSAAAQTAKDIQKKVATPATSVRAAAAAAAKAAADATQKQSAEVTRNEVNSAILSRKYKR